MQIARSVSVWGPSSEIDECAAARGGRQSARGCGRPNGVIEKGASKIRRISPVSPRAEERPVSGSPEVRIPPSLKLPARRGVIVQLDLAGEAQWAPDGFARPNHTIYLPGDEIYMAPIDDIDASNLRPFCAPDRNKITLNNTQPSKLDKPVTRGSRAPMRIPKSDTRHQGATSKQYPHPAFRNRARLQLSQTNVGRAHNKWPPRQHARSKPQSS